MIVVADTGFISSLLKINRAELILKLFGVNRLLVPTLVFYELEKSSFFGKVSHLFSYREDSKSWIQIIDVKSEENSEFGNGELAAMKLAKENSAVLLIDELNRAASDSKLLKNTPPHTEVQGFLNLRFSNDKKAFKEAEKSGLLCLDLASFLFSCKEVKLLDEPHMQSIIRELKENDYYLFSKEILELLLS